MPEVTVAIPVRDGGELLARTLAALGRQTVAHELLVCDSGSRDGSPALARAHGARVLEIEPRAFSHGGTRNLLMREAAGAHVALLTQDAEPVDERWLEQLLAGFELADDVGIVYGPYRPRPDAAGRGAGRAGGLVRLAGARRRARCRAPDEAERAALPAAALLGRRGFFTDANACLARAAWERVPFRAVPYAEDRVLALDMLRAGYAKAFVPAAAVWHSHDYTARQQLRRCFDEWRGLREVYGWREPADPRSLLGQLRGALGAARRDPALAGAAPGAAPGDARGGEPSPCGASRGCRARLAGRPPAAPSTRRAVARAPAWLRRARSRPRHSNSSTRLPTVNDEQSPQPRRPAVPASGSGARAQASGGPRVRAGRRAQTTGGPRVERAAQAAGDSGRARADRGRRARGRPARAVRGPAAADRADDPVPRLAHAAVPPRSRSRCASRR